MGRKGVSKRKKAKEKVAPVSPVSGSISSLIGRKTETQPEQATEKGKAWPKGNKKR